MFNRTQYSSDAKKIMLDLLLTTAMLKTERSEAFFETVPNYRAHLVSHFFSFSSNITVVEMNYIKLVAKTHKMEDYLTDRIHELCNLSALKTSILMPLPPLRYQFKSKSVLSIFDTINHLILESIKVFFEEEKEDFSFEREGFISIRAFYLDLISKDAFQNDFMQILLPQIVHNVSFRKLNLSEKALMQQVIGDFVERFPPLEIKNTEAVMEMLKQLD